MKRTLAIASIFVTMACGTLDDEPPDAPDADLGPPRVRILVIERPHDVTSLEQELDEARYGDALHVIVDGVAAGAVVTVESTSGAGTSSARFAATADGTIDLARDAPLGGDWRDPHVDALLSSMRDPPAGPLDLTVTVRALDHDGVELARDVVARRYVNDGLIVEQVNEGRTQGLLALPQGEGPFPAVLVFGGSEGGTGTGEFAAMYLASLGYAALGVGYFGAPGLPSELSQVPLELLEEDLALLTGDPRVDAERVVVMGGSRGGELALLLGATFPTIVRGVVAQVPSGLVWGSTIDAEVAAWTWHGAPIAFVPSSGAQADVDVDGDGVAHWRARDQFLADIAAADPTVLDLATIRAEDIAGPVLFWSGDDDQLWPSCVLADIAVQRRASAGVGAGDQVFCGVGAGHSSVGVPGWSTVDSVEVFLPEIDGYLVLGGTPEGNARALREGDTALRAFLEALSANQDRAERDPG